MLYLHKLIFIVYYDITGVYDKQEGCMIKIQCQGCEAMVDIGRICRECGASVPSSVYEGAAAARDAYSKIPGVLVQLNTIGAVNISNIGAAVKIFQECAELLQKLDAYQSFFQGDFDTLKNKNAALDTNIQAMQRQYNADVNDLIDKMNALIGSVNKANFQRAKSLCYTVRSFKKSEYDTGQYARLQNKKDELEQKFARVEDQIAARKELNSRSVKRWIVFLLYWGAAATGALVFFSKVYPYLAISDTTPEWGMTVLWGSLIFDGVLFLVFGGILGGVGGAIGSLIGGAVVLFFAIYRISKIGEPAGTIILLVIQAVLLFIPLIIIYHTILGTKAFDVSRELKARANRRGPTPVTAFVLIALAAAGTFVWHSYSNPPLTDNMVLIESGTFTMGSPDAEPGREAIEGPQHQVTLPSFYMGKNEVTVGEFREFVDTMQYNLRRSGGNIVVGDNWVEKDDASWDNPYLTQTDQDPVVLISWYDAVNYCNWRSIQEKLIPAYFITDNGITWNKKANGYRLPTEAEWEYACRAGAETPFSAGNNITAKQANYDGNSPYNGNARGEYRKTTTPVGSFDPNPWGLYDMHGNVYEWCWDSYSAYSGDAQTAPAGPPFPVTGVARGGSWYRSGRFLRSASRVWYAPSYRDNTLGFRLALSGRDQTNAADKAGPSKVVKKSTLTFTFNPRLVGTKGGVAAGGWLVKITKNGDYTSLYLTDSPSGKGKKEGLSFGPSATLTLQDLDNPAKRWTATRDASWDKKTGAWVITFKDVTAVRLKYVETEPNPDWIIEEIVLGEPD
jgi:formylglycine-generating enzyme required for sulfatase activity